MIREGFGGLKWKNQNQILHITHSFKQVTLNTPWGHFWTALPSFVAASIQWKSLLNSTKNALQKNLDKVSIIETKAACLSWDVLARNSYFTHAKTPSLINADSAFHASLRLWMQVFTSSSKVWIRTLVYLSYMNRLFVCGPCRLLTCDPVDKLGHHFLILHSFGAFKFLSVCPSTEHWYICGLIYCCTPQFASRLVLSGSVQCVRAFKASNSLLLL